MSKPKSSRPDLSFRSSFGPRKSISLPDVAYSKTAPEHIEIHLNDIRDLNNPSHDTPERRRPDWEAVRVAELTTPSLWQHVAAPVIKDKSSNQCEGRNTSQQSMQAHTITEDDVHKLIDGHTSGALQFDSRKTSDGSLKEFDTASDTNWKGMAKGHYADKNRRMKCYSCEKQFKMKRKPRHCRKCGEVFCVKCVKFKRKLNILAHPDPEGKARKVCRACLEEDALIFGCSRSLIDEFTYERQLVKYARVISKRVNSLTTTFWPDEIDRREECLRLIAGFQHYAKQLGSTNSLQALKMKLKTPTWQKSKYWSIEIQASNCRACKRDVGLRKSSGNCRVCGLALCKKCSYKELLLFYGDDEDIREANIAIINVPGCPSEEPNISVLLYICRDCKAYISKQQATNLLWYKLEARRCIVDDILQMDATFVSLQETIRNSVARIEELLNNSDDIHISSSDRRHATSEITNLRKHIDEYETNFKTLRSWWKQVATETQHRLLKNYMKSKYDYVMEHKYKCRALRSKADHMK